jgi:hypothetical protein
MVIMSVMAVAAISSSLDQQRSSQAVRLSGEAFYAAETGLNAIQAEWNDTSGTLDGFTDTLSSGGVIDLGWDTLPSGARYTAQLRRIDNGGQDVFLVTVNGEDASGRGGGRSVSLIITGIPGGGAVLGSYSLGDCCTAAATIRGVTELDDDSHIDGHDFGTPPGWDGDRCSGIPTDDKPGLLMDDASLFNKKDSGSILDGVPAIQEESMTDSDFNSFGGLSYDSIMALATHTIVDEGNVRPGTASAQYGPRYLADGSCDYDHPRNFGAPTGPCADHFPIIRLAGDVQFQGGYIQGIVIMDKDFGVGGELDFESGTTFVGLVIGMGCVEVQDGSEVYGGIYVDGNYLGAPSCNGDPPLAVDTDASQLDYSSCAIQRALEGSGLGEASDTTTGLPSLVKISTRSFSELLR